LGCSGQLNLLAGDSEDSASADSVGRDEMSDRLDECTIYVFVRQDIPLAQQLVQASHAAFHMGLELPNEAGIPFMCVIGMPNLSAMNRVLAKLDSYSIRHHAFTDVDVEEGFTAIATIPLNAEQKIPLANYRLWRYSPSASAVPSMAKGEPNADVAQLREHPVSNGKVVGENPAISSNFLRPQADGDPGDEDDAK
jgi:hypothetical protein